MIASIGAALLAMAAMPAQAQILLTFEGVGNVADIGNFYNGGTDSFGNSGTNYGVSFTNGLGLVDSDAGGSGNIANLPSGSTALVYVSSSSAMNVAGGFNGQFSFFYSSSTNANVLVYDGLNGAGSLLATIPLSANYMGNGCVGDPSGAYCNWTQTSAAFSGTARSVSFGGASGLVVFDNLTLGGAGGAPEPSTWAFMILGFGTAGFALRRGQRPAAARQFA